MARIYTPEQITEMAANVTSKVEETGSLVAAMDELTADGAPKVSLTALSAATTMLSFGANALGSVPASATLAMVANGYAAAAIGQESADGEYTWDDLAALSTAIGSTLMINPDPLPATKLAAVLFSALGWGMPYLNAGGYWLGGAAYRAINSDTNTFFLQFKNWIPPRRDPLALDLDNDGIETVGITGTVVVFDHDGDGIKTGTGWVLSDDGFLVLDRNDNGTIDAGAELFGVDTVKADGTLAVDGFDALADLDTNADGLFDVNDDEFAHVQIWQDLNQNGISTADELFSLAELGVISIDLNASSQNVNLGNGNVQTASAAHLTVDGEGETGNLDLANNPFYSEFVDNIPLTEEALSLPDSKGSGLVRDLREAVSLSPTLASALSNFSSQTNYTDQKAQLDDVLSAWAETSTVKNSVEQATDNGFFLFYLTPDQLWEDFDQHMSYWNTTDSSVLNALSTEDRASYDALQLQQQEFVELISTLEQFNASTFVTVDADSVTRGNGFQSIANPVPDSSDTSTERVFVSLSTAQMGLMQQSYESLKESVYGSLVLQTHLAQYLDEITLDVTVTGEVFVNFAALNALLDAQKIANPAAALADLIELNKYAGEVLQQNGWTGLDMLRSWVDEGVGGVETDAILKDLSVSFIEGDVSAGIQSDLIISRFDNTAVIGGAGNDILNDSFVSRSIYGLAGNDTINGNIGDDVLYGGDGNDILNGGDGIDTLFGGAGDDTLSGGIGATDYLIGEAGNDTYLFKSGDGNTSIINLDTGVGRQDVLRFDVGINASNVTAERSLHSLKLTVQSTGEVITVENYFVNDDYVLNAIEFDDGTSWDVATVKQMVIQTTVGNDNVTGYETDDTIDGLDGDDILSGVGGNDILYGSAGNDALWGVEGNDTLNGGIGDDALHGGNGNDILNGGDGNDTLFGGAGDDTLSGGTGVNDYLNGDSGNDTYLFAAGDGNTTISNVDTGVGRQDVLHFDASIIPSDVLATRSGNSLKLTVQSTSEEITVSSYFFGDEYTLNAIEFSDGTSWDVATVYQMTQQGTAGNDNITGNETVDDTIDGLGGNDILSGVGGNDTLYGSAGNDTLHGGEDNDILNGGMGDDVMFGGNGNDILNGGDGTDSLFGDAGDDTLSGGVGVNDFLRGGAGNDTYLFAAGDGNTSISNVDTGVGRQDVLHFDVDINPSDVLATRSANSLKLTIATTSEVITVENHFFGEDYALNAIEFSDGTSWDLATVNQMVLQGTAGNDTLVGTAIDDTLDGLGGNDTLSGAGGNDTLNGDADNDTLNGGEGNDTLNGGTGTDTLQGNNGDDILDGGDGLDTLFGGAGNDILSGGIGANDYMTGDAGNDIYLFASGDGNTTISNYDAGVGRQDVLRFDAGIIPSDIQVARSGNYLKLTLQSTGEVVTVQNHFINSSYMLNAVEFADGTNWDSATLASMSLNATEGADTITGFAADETIDGLGGNDIISGADGNDTLSGGTGNDTLRGDNGDDILDGGDGTDGVYGGAGNDTLSGGVGANDFLTGDAGNDIYLFASGDGNTTISNYDAGVGRQDVLHFDTGITPSDVQVTRSGNYLKLTLQSTGEVVTIQNHFINSSYMLNAVEFTDGTIWDNTTLASMVLNGTEGNDSITGFTTDDTINGFGGNDTLYGGNGNDSLNGGDGNDTVSGQADDDIVSGNAGDDIIYGNAGNDTLHGGSGHDVLYGDTGSDTIDGGTSFDTMTGGADSDTFVYNTGDSIASVAVSSIISGANLEVADKIAFTNGVDVITDFTTGVGGDVFDGANAGMPITGVGVPLIGGFASGTTYFVSGAWAGNIFTVAADGVGADTMIIEGSGVDQGLIEDYVILVGVDSDDIVAANFI